MPVWVHYYYYYTTQFSYISRADPAGGLGVGGGGCNPPFIRNTAPKLPVPKCPILRIPRVQPVDKFVK